MGCAAAQCYEVLTFVGSLDSPVESSLNPWLHLTRAMQAAARHEDRVVAWHIGSI